VKIKPFEIKKAH